MNELLEEAYVFMENWRRLSWDYHQICLLNKSFDLFTCYCSPALKKWGYTGFAMSFCGSVTPSFRDSVTAKLKCILLNNFYVCGPTSMKLILHLVSKVSKV